MKNDYAGLIEGWKNELIVARARRRGFARHDLEDIQQEVILPVLEFEFLEEKSNGATEQTALTALIDRRVTDVLRKNIRRKQQHDTYVNERSYLDRDQAEESHAREIDTQLDVRVVVEKLPPLERSICTALASGVSWSRIVRLLGISRNKADAVFERIRARFVDAGFGEKA